MWQKAVDKSRFTITVPLSKDNKILIALSMLVYSKAPKSRGM